VRHSRDIAERVPQRHTTRAGTTGRHSLEDRCLELCPADRAEGRPHGSSRRLRLPGGSRVWVLRPTRHDTPADGSEARLGDEPVQDARGRERERLVPQRCEQQTAQGLAHSGDDDAVITVLWSPLGGDHHIPAGGADAPQLG